MQKAAALVIDASHWPATLFQRAESKEQMPAPNAGGHYKCNDDGGFVEASPSRAFREGEGTFLFKLTYQRGVQR